MKKTPNPFNALVIALAAAFLSFAPAASHAGIILANPIGDTSVNNTFWGSPGLRLWVDLNLSSGSYSIDRADFFFGQSGGGPGGVAVPSAYVNIIETYTTAILGTSSTAYVTTPIDSAYYITSTSEITNDYRMTFNFASPVVLTPGAYQIQVLSADNNQFNYFYSPSSISTASVFVDSYSPLFELYGTGGEPVPEPGTWAAAALLLGGAGFARWRKRAKVS